MKKLMSVAALVMVMCLLLTGCQELPFELPFDLPFLHQHEWQDATCLAPKTCACGATEGEALGHTPGEEATCTAAQICTVCNAELAPVKDHTPGKEATCDTAQKCTVCKVVLAEATGVHTPGAEATCNTAQTCTVCMEILKDATGVHTPGAEPTCSAPQTCTVCSEVLKESNPELHVPGAEATCTTAQTCTACSAVVTPAKGHTLNDDKLCTVCNTQFTAKNYAFNFDHQVFTKEDTKVLNGIEWTLVADWGNKGKDDPKYGDTFKSVDSADVNKAKNVRGQQFSSGSASGHMNWMTLTSTNALTNVSKIKIRTNGASGFEGTVAVTVNGKEVGKFTLGTTYNDVEGYDYDYYNFEMDVANLSGVVEFRFDQPETAKAFYVGGIYIDYAE